MRTALLSLRTFYYILKTIDVLSTTKQKLHYQNLNYAGV